MIEYHSQTRISLMLSSEPGTFHFSFSALISFLIRIEFVLKYGTFLPTLPFSFSLFMACHPTLLYCPLFYLEMLQGSVCPGWPHVTTVQTSSLAAFGPQNSRQPCVPNSDSSCFLGVCA